LAPVAAAATPSRALPPTSPVAQTAAVNGLLDAFGRGVADLQRSASTPGGSSRPSLTAAEATSIARSSGRLQDWIDDHPIARTAASLQSDDVWKVSFVSRAADRSEKVEAEVFVEDDSGEITEVRTGPQVAWFMARGHDDAFGRSLNTAPIWTALCVAFLLPLLRFRRLLSLRTLDLLAVLGFTLSWIWFQKGEIFTSVPLQYLPLGYLGGRLAWIGVRRARQLAREADPDADAGAAPVAEAAPAPARPSLANWCPTWLVVSVLAAVLVLRWGLNAFDSNVIDVGYAGVIGADLIQEGATPYGNFPENCGRCDTYGPLTYMTYVPFRALLGWSGRWDDLPAAHGAATFFDLLALAGMLLLGRRLGGWRLGALLALAWAAVPWSAYTLESNANDALVGALLAWGLAFAARPFMRGLGVTLAVAAKFTPAVLLPLWFRHPFPRARRSGARRRVALFAAGIAAGVAATGWVLLLDGLDGVRAIWSRTIGYQADRESPFSVWGQYPGLRPLQIAIGVAVLLAAVALVRWPRRLDLLSMAAFSGALLIGAQVVLEHWFYLYIPWFLPFVLAVVVPEWPHRAAPRRAAAADALPADPVPVAS
ncbi:MAG: glycosyltransferase 87 family protein, partial [Actinomycetota bacterium]